MTKLTHDDYYFSAKKAVEDHFKFFNYPAKSSFSEEGLEHVYRIASSILMTKDGFQMGGGFVQAVVEDRMSLAYSRADSTMLRAMRIMCYVATQAEIFKADPAFQPIG